MSCKMKSFMGDKGHYKKSLWKQKGYLSPDSLLSNLSLINFRDRAAKCHLFNTLWLNSLYSSHRNTTNYWTQINQREHYRNEQTLQIYWKQTNTEVINTTEDIHCELIQKTVKQLHQKTFLGSLGQHTILMTNNNIYLYHTQV